MKNLFLIEKTYKGPNNFEEGANDTSRYLVFSRPEIKSLDLLKKDSGYIFSMNDFSYYARGVFSSLDHIENHIKNNLKGFRYTDDENQERLPQHEWFEESIMTYKIGGLEPLTRSETGALVYDLLEDLKIETEMFRFTDNEKNSWINEVMNDAKSYGQLPHEPTIAQAFEDCAIDELNEWME